MLVFSWRGSFVTTTPPHGRVGDILAKMQGSFLKAFAELDNLLHRRQKSNIIDREKLF